MKNLIFFLCLNFLAFPAVFGLNVRELTVQAIEYTIASKIKSKVFNVSGMISVGSMVLLKDGRKHRFSFEDAPNVWINYVYNDDLGRGQFDWKSETKDAKSPGKVAIHRNYCQVYELLPPMERMLEAARSKEGVYSLANGNYQNIPCYKISVRYPADDKTISTASLYDFHPNYTYTLANQNPGFVGVERHMTPELFDTEKAGIREEYFAWIQLLVDKTPGRPFIYAMEAFNRNGKRIYDMNWGDVQFLDHIDPTEFQLPGSKVITVNNHKEFSKQNRIYFRDIYTKNEPGVISRVFTSMSTKVEQNMSEILNWGGKITFYLAIVAAVIAIVLKISAKRKSNK